MSPSVYHPRPPRRAVGSEFVTTAEAAAELRVSSMTVNRLVHSGALKAVRVGRQFRIYETSLQDYIRVQLIGGEDW